MRKLDSVLDDVHFIFERRIDVDGGVSDKERPRIIRGVDNKHMAHPPGGPKLFLVDDRAHELVGMETALHQGFDLSIARECDRLRCSRMAMFGRDELIAREVELGLFRGSSNFRLRSNQDRDNELFLSGLDGAKQRDRIHWVDYSGADWREAARFLNEFLVVAAFH